MTERISKLTIDSGIRSNTSPKTLTVRGYATTPYSRGVMDSMLVNATGFEGPKLTVTGGDASFGGSVFTGITPNNREYVLTLRPMGEDLNTIKNRLNTLIALSQVQPLTLYVSTLNEYGVDSHLYTEGYISDISAPLFSDKREIVVTFISPLPYLQRNPVSVRSIHEVIPNFKPSRGMLSVMRKEGNDDDSAISAPSTFSIGIAIPKEFAPKIHTIRVIDGVGNAYSAALMGFYRDVHELKGDAIVSFDIRSRQVVLTDEKDNVAFKNPYVTTIGEWPTVYPLLTNLSIEMEYTGSEEVAEGLKDSYIYSYVVYPRVYGL